MGIAVFPSSGGVKVDKSACIPFGSPAGTVSLTTAYQTLQSITFKGFLDIALLQGSGGTFTLRITVDGALKFEGSATTSATGVTKRELFFNNAAVLAIIQPNAPTAIASVSSTAGLIFGFPYTANVAQAQTLSIAADSIFFNTSLLIEAKASSAISGVGYHILGGYQP